MSAFLTRIYIYIVDDNYFNGNLMKNIVTESKIPNSSVVILPPNQLEKVLNGYQTDINDIFLFSIDITGNRCFYLASLLRKQCKKCQIGFYGVRGSQLKAEKLNFISSLGVIDTNARNLSEQVKRLLVEATTIKKEILQEKNLVRLSNKKEVFFFDIDSVNFITTIKGERNRIEIHQSKSIDYIHTAIKELKKIDLPEYFLIFKFYIINLKQIKKINRSSNTLIFFNGEHLEMGKRISAVIMKKYIN
ncbi:LytTR family transcriptional regulator DNA-binding domain-containing protein [Enterococcus casseliflavus]|uniref:LytTR family transcriptional regulator DNA-binding domain-containing protein n=1 Tax=Enterococcus casseliflavus TaxID=37734 RepID=UPI0039A40021